MEDAVRGTELTLQQLDRAKEFVHIAQVVKGDLPDEQLITLPFGDLVRLVAWYGAMRFEAGQKGIGTLEVPASPTVVKRS
jgi:hypothetical protein